MRGLFSLCLFAAACTPEITTGTYLCGPEELCPDDLACDGKTNLCVNPTLVEPFACAPDDTEIEPNNSPAEAEPVPLGGCSTTVELTGCEGAAGDTADYFSFVVPASCPASTVVAVRLSYPLAYEPPAINVLSSGTDILTDQPCATAGSDANGDGVSCGRGPVVAGMTYTVEVTGSGEANCGGMCAHNRYRLTVQLTQ
jgi:hypothetical protein